MSRRVDDLERQLQAAEARTRAVETELKGVRPRLEAMEGDLAVHR